MDNGTCLAITLVDNCLFYSGVNGDCAVCASQYFLDTATKKCVSVETANLITNCNAYGSNQICLNCEDEYYVSQATCVAIDAANTITNCRNYLNTNTCNLCDEGYLLSLDLKKCTQPTNTTNCSNYTTVKCETCGSGTVRNYNLGLLFLEVHEVTDNPSISSLTGPNLTQQRQL